MLLIRKLAGAAMVLLVASQSWAAELVMVEEPGCVWCARWNEEIAPAYPNTDEGRFAPLRRVDIRDIPPDVQTRRGVRFTPTFLLVVDGAEVARMEGYPGDQFFWPLLARMLSDHTPFKGSNG